MCETCGKRVFFFCAQESVMVLFRKSFFLSSKFLEIPKAGSQRFCVLYLIRSMRKVEKTVRASEDAATHNLIRM
jgi:hypothetical protein